MKRTLTGRECIYIGTKCQYRDEDGNCPCWNPATHRVTTGPYGGWWFVCFDHIEFAAQKKHCRPGTKASVRHLALSPAQAAGARLLVQLKLWCDHLRRSYCGCCEVRRPSKERWRQKIAAAETREKRIALIRSIPPDLKRCRKCTRYFCPACYERHDCK